jgi:hypothetical protein
MSQPKRSRLQQPEAKSSQTGENNDMKILVAPKPTETEVGLFHRMYAKTAQTLAQTGWVPHMAFCRVGAKSNVHNLPGGSIVEVSLHLQDSEFDNDCFGQELQSLVRLLHADLVVWAFAFCTAIIGAEEASCRHEKIRPPVSRSNHPKRIEFLMFSVQKSSGDGWTARVPICRDTNGWPHMAGEFPDLQYGAYSIIDDDLFAGLW